VLIRKGFAIQIESGLGARAGFDDESYRKAGCEVATDRAAGLREADIVLRVRKPDASELGAQKRGAVHISFLDPFQEKDLIAGMRQAGLSAISMEMVPRITIAQKMDALSSQANLAGYMAVIRAAARLPKALPMLMTAAGTISPAKVLIIGVGVAGLQAIATAKRLGARVQAFDTRPVVEEQVQSLGAKFLKIDLGETGETKGGYAKELTPEQLEKQRQGMAKACADADIVITTAKVFGRPAPRILTEEMVAGMKRGSVVVDMAIESGGNVAGGRLDDEVITDNGVRIIGVGALEALVAADASRMYANNVLNLLDHFYEEENKRLVLKDGDPILEGCLITHGGEIVHEKFRDASAPPPPKETPPPAEEKPAAAEPEKSATPPPPPGGTIAESSPASPPPPEEEGGDKAKPAS
jgi:NAD(P) transhydrogenase subunit alpha